jgi:endonuclease I
MAARQRLVVAFAVLAVGPLGIQLVSADQTKISSYSAATKQAYALYVDARSNLSTDIYCGLRFKVDPENTDERPATWLSLEHAYPADWMADVFGCANRTECRKHSDTASKARCNHAEGELHNLLPALIDLNSARGKRLFGEIPGTESREVTIGTKTFTCDFQLEGNVVEPRRIAKGNLARGILYMCAEYDFPVDPEMLVVLKR